MLCKRASKILICFLFPYRGTGQCAVPCRQVYQKIGQIGHEGGGPLHISR